MKLLLAALTAFAVGAACADCPPSDKSLPFNKSTPIYVPGVTHEALSLESYKQRLPLWLAAQPPALLFVHGRGDEPAKSVIGLPVGWGDSMRGQALRKLAYRGVSPLMFNWNSVARGLDRDCPKQNVEAAAQAFTELLQVHADLLKQRPDLPRPVLLVHSMGALVIQSVVEQKRWPATSRLFQRIVFSEPDVDRQGHEVWMSALADQESVWVTWTRTDLVLNFAWDDRSRDIRSLGLGVPRGEPLAKGVRYVDLSEASRFNHTVVVEGTHKPGSWVNAFFNRLFSGQDVNPASDEAVARIDARGVIWLRPETVSQLADGPRPPSAAQ